MPDYITDETRERLLCVPFDKLNIEEQFTAQLLLLKEPALCTHMLHPETMKKWLNHCYARNTRAVS